VLVTLFNLTFPDNALFLFKLISQISRFNLIPIDHIVNSWFRFTPHIAGEEVINENFRVMGYESWNLMQTLDTVLLFIIGIGVSVILTSLVNLLVPIPLR
jgi:hypothetical protein